MNEAAITLDGWYVLHDLRSMDWASWKLVSKEERQAAVDEFLVYLEKLQKADDDKTGAMLSIQLLDKKLISCS